MNQPEIVIEVRLLLSWSSVWCAANFYFPRQLNFSALRFFSMSSSRTKIWPNWSPTETTAQYHKPSTARCSGWVSEQRPLWRMHYAVSPTWDRLGSCLVV